MASKRQKELGLLAALAAGAYLLARRSSSSGDLPLAGGSATGPTPGTAGLDPMLPGAQPGKTGNASPTSPPPAPVGGYAGPGSDPGAGGVIADTPTPGMLYRIKSGDTLLGVAGKAWGFPAGQARLAASITINEDPWNVANATYSTITGHEVAWYGPERLSFGYPYQVINIPEQW